MKKLMILAVALFSMTTTFAADENASATTATAAFNMNVNMNSLSDALGLNIDQVEAVADVHKNFTADMMNAAVAAGDDRKAMIDKAINKDLKYMHVILSNTQYRSFADGELPQERKVYPAVQISHPAVTLGHIIQRAEQSVRSFFVVDRTSQSRVIICRYSCQTIIFRYCGIGKIVVSLQP